MGYSRRVASHCFAAPTSASKAPPLSKGVIPGSSCIVNAYSSNHELLASSPDMSTARRLVLHAVDAVGLVHALLLRIQALVLPVQALVFSGH